MDFSKIIRVAGSLCKKSRQLCPSLYASTRSQTEMVSSSPPTTLIRCLLVTSLSRSVPLKHLLFHPSLKSVLRNFPLNSLFAARIFLIPTICIHIKLSSDIYGACQYALCLQWEQRQDRLCSWWNTQALLHIVITAGAVLISHMQR